MDLPSIEILQATKLIPEPLIFDNDILVLVEEVIDFKFEFRNSHILLAELFLQFNKLVLKLNPEFTFVVQVILELFLRLFEFLPLVFKHVFDFSEIMVLVEAALVYLMERCTALGVAVVFRDGAVAHAVLVVVAGSDIVLTEIAH